MRNNNLHQTNGIKNEQLEKPRIIKYLAKAESDPEVSNASCPPKVGRSISNSPHAKDRRINKCGRKRLMLGNDRKGASSIVRAFLQLNLQDEGKSFDSLWSSFMLIVGNHFKVVALKLKPLTPIGQTILKSGRFLIKYHQLLTKEPCISGGISAKFMFEEYSDKVEEFSDDFLNYFLDRINETPKAKVRSQQTSPPQKRSILKSKSLKKSVSFHKEIHYPLGQSYTICKQEEQKQRRRKHFALYMDYFGIPDHCFYFAHQIHLIGVIDKIEDAVAIINFRLRGSMTTKFALAVLDQTKCTTQTLHIVRKNHSRLNLSFVDLQGQQLDEFFLNALDSHLTVDFDQK